MVLGKLDETEDQLIDGEVVEVAGVVDGGCGGFGGGLAGEVPRVDDALVFGLGFRGAVFAQVVIFAVKADDALAAGVAADLRQAG
ncbi:MAG: hypothetical protein ACKO16_02465 [Gemmataceae bacterium]